MFARVARDMCALQAASALPFGQAARFHAVRGNRARGTLRDSRRFPRPFATGEQFRRTQHHLAAVARFDPARFAFESHRDRSLAGIQPVSRKINSTPFSYRATK